MKDPEHEPQEIDPATCNRTDSVDPGNGMRQGTLQFGQASKGFSDHCDPASECSSPVHYFDHASHQFFHKHVNNDQGEALSDLDHTPHERCTDNNCPEEHNNCETCGSRRHVVHLDVAAAG